MKNLLFFVLVFVFTSINAQFINNLENYSLGQPISEDQLTERGDSNIEGDDDSNRTIQVSFSTSATNTPTYLTADIDQLNGEVLLNWVDEVNGINDFFDNGISGVWIPVNGNWSATNETYKAASASEYETVSSYYDVDFSNFELEVKMCKTYGSNINVGIHFNGDSNTITSTGYWQNAYSLKYNTDGKWSLQKKLNGTLTLLQSWETSPDINTGMGAWNTLKVICVDGYMDIYFNNILQGSFFDNSHLSGKIGLQLYDIDAAGTAEFDYVTLTNLSKNHASGTVDQSENRNVYTSGNCANNYDNYQDKIRDTKITPTPAFGAKHTNICKGVNGFLNYNVYRDGNIVGTTTETTYTDILPVYGTYEYYITALFDDGESDPTNTVTITYEGVSDIAVNPTSLTETLSVGETSTQILSITNNGDGDLNFTISATEIGSKSKTNWTTLIDNSEDTIENAIDNITSQLGFSKRPFNQIDTDFNILVLEDTPDMFYYEEALINLGLSYTLETSWGLWEIELTNGTEWDLIIVNSYTYGSSSIPQTLEILNNYQFNGGLLIFSHFDIDYYEPHSLLTSLGVHYLSKYTIPIDFSATDPSHILFNQPNQISNWLWTDDQHPYGTDGQIVDIIGEAQQLASFEGYPDSGAIVLNETENCIFNAFQADNFRGDDNSNGKSDMVELIENQITLLTGGFVSWLSSDPVEETVASGSSMDIEIFFDATNLTPGIYIVNLEISSNDPDEPIVTIPVELTVTPNIGVSENTIEGLVYFPNPVDHNLNMRANDLIDSVSIINVLGEKVLNYSINNKSSISIDTTGLSSGTYFVRILSNSKFGVFKILKK